MFFFKKSIPTTYDWGISADIHNHVLPGIDDGAKDIAQSLRLLEGLQELGFERVNPTPHIASGLYRNDRTTIGEACYLLQQSTAAAPINGMVKGFAAEYMVDDYFEQLLEEGLVCYPNSSQSKYVLIEFSYIALPSNWHDIVFSMRRKGYQPVLAHPERYSYAASTELLEKFADAGCLLQLNLLSLSGYYGKEASTKARFLLKQGLYQFAGTDAHHQQHIEALKKMKQDKALSALISQYHFENDVL